MTAIRTYRDLPVWQKSMDLAVEMYTRTRDFPPEERCGLTSQLRRSAAAIPASIAEGQGRLHRAEYLRFISAARGSLAGLETDVQIAVRLQYWSRDEAREVWALLQEVGRLLNALVRALESGTVSEDGSGYAPDPEPDPPIWSITPSESEP